MKTLVIKVFKSQNSGFEIIAFKVFECIVKSEEKEFFKCLLIFLFSGIFGVFKTSLGYFYH